MRIDWWTLGLQAVNVLVLVWLLARFLFRPVAAMVAARQAEAARILDEAAAARAAAEEARRAAADEAARQAAGRAVALKAAAAEAETEKAALLAAARAEADGLRAAAGAEAERRAAEEAEAQADRAGRLAVDIAAKLLASLPDTVRVLPFLDGLAAAVASLPAATQAEMGADGRPLRLKAARALTAEEAETCRARLAETLGRPVDLAPEVDDALVAGLELEGDHAVVRNSFRADLDRIAAELTRHGGGRP